MFDPPFVVSGTPTVNTGKIRDRFSSFATVASLYQFYGAALLEFQRVLRPGGVIAFKCQDMVSSNRQHLSHVAIVNGALKIGLRVEDLFVLVRTTMMFSPNMANQQHARKRHCYYLVFRKEGKP